MTRELTPHNWDLDRISRSFSGYDFGITDNNIIKFTTGDRTEFIYKGFGENREDDSQLGNWSRSGNTLTIEWDRK